MKALEDGGYDGIGFEFNNNGIVGIDLDHMIVKEGSLSEEAIEIVSMLDGCYWRKETAELIQFDIKTARDICKNTMMVAEK